MEWNWEQICKIVRKISILKPIVMFDSGQNHSLKRFLSVSRENRIVNYIIA